MVGGMLWWRRSKPVTNEEYQALVVIAAAHALADPDARYPMPNDVVVEISHMRERPPDPAAIGRLCWWPTLAAWDDEYPDLKRETWNVQPLNGQCDSEGCWYWTWERADFWVVPSLEKVLLEARTLGLVGDDTVVVPRRPGR